MSTDTRNPLHAAEPVALLDQYLTLAIEHMSTDDTVEEYRLADLMDPLWDRMTEGQRGIIKKYNMALHKAASAPSQPDVQDAVGRFAIKVEKMMCAKLGRPWSASGISIETLIDSLYSAQPSEGPARVTDIFVKNVRDFIIRNTGITRDELGSLNVRNALEFAEREAVAAAEGKGK